VRLPTSMERMFIAGRREHQPQGPPPNPGWPVQPRTGGGAGWQTLNVSGSRWPIYLAAAPGEQEPGVKDD